MLPFNSICNTWRLPKPSNSGYCKPIRVCDKDLYEAGKIHCYAIQEGPNEYPKNCHGWKPPPSNHYFVGIFVEFLMSWAIFTSKVPQNDEINCKMDSHTKWEDNFPKAPVLKLPNSLKKSEARRWMRATKMPRDPRSTVWDLRIHRWDSL